MSDFTTIIDEVIYRAIPVEVETAEIIDEENYRNQIKDELRHELRHELKEEIKESYRNSKEAEVLKLGNGLSAHHNISHAYGYASPNRQVILSSTNGTFACGYSPESKK